MTFLNESHTSLSQNGDAVLQVNSDGTLAGLRHLGDGELIQVAGLPGPDRLTDGSLVIRGWDGSRHAKSEDGRRRKMT